MSKFSKSLKNFLGYVSERNMYFGKPTLTTLGFLVMYLNYDSSHNFLRKYILKNTNLSNWEINQKVLEAIIDSHERGGNLRVIGSKELEKIPMSMELTLLVSNALRSCENKKESIALSEFIYFVFFEDVEDNQNDYFIRAFEDVFGLRRIPTKRTLIKEMVDKTEPAKQDFEIPEAIGSYISIIDGRKEEYNFSKIENISEMVWENLQKYKMNTVALVGERSVGKKNFIQKIAYDIDHGNAPEMFKNYTVIKVDLFKIIGDITEKRPATIILKDIFDFLNSQSNIIVFLDHFYVTEKYDGVLNGITRFFGTKNFRMIISMSAEGIKKFSEEEKMAKSTIAFYINEPERKDLEERLKPSIMTLSLQHGVLISQDMLKTAILYTLASKDGTVSFADTKNSIDTAMVKALNKHHLYVEKADILELYKEIFKLYDKEPDTAKYSTAIHEAGHFTVSRFCKSYTDVIVTFVSILPETDGTMGYNAFEFDFSKIQYSDKKYFEESLAVALGGRAAEKVILGKVSSGAQADYEAASDTVREVISSFDLNEEDDNSVRLNENMTSDASIERVDEEAQKMFQNAYTLSAKIITEHKDYVEAVANILLDKQVVSADEIKSYEVKKDGKVTIEYTPSERLLKKPEKKTE